VSAAMKTFLDCIPCFLKQALDACRMAGDDEQMHARVLRKVLHEACRLSFDRSPPEMGTRIHRIIRKETGNPDPYLEVKQHFNGFILGLLPGLRKRVEAAADPFETAVRLAIAGNIIDFALADVLSEEFVSETIEDTLVRPLSINHLESLRAAVDSASSILYLADNAGEIALDKLLLERLPRGKTTLVVRGSPVINDATRDDAAAVGIGDLAEVMDNGTDVPGTILDRCPEEFRKVFSEADLVISKGQGNYETLSGEQREIFHLFKAKCPVISRDVGCDVGQVVVLRRKNARTMPA